MKILGEKSLSSKVIVGLNGLFAFISFIDLVVLSLIAKVIIHIIRQENIENNILDLSLFTMIVITGIIALFIIYQFIKIFKDLKGNILFSKDNVKRLDKISNSCFAVSGIYLIISIFILIAMNYLVGNGYIFAFSIMLTILLAVFGVGIKVLNEIYKKAIEYKEENDFTI